MSVDGRIVYKRCWRAAVTVSFPDDLDSYTEVDHDLLAGALAAA